MEVPEEEEASDFCGEWSKKFWSSKFWWLKESVWSLVMLRRKLIAQQEDRGAGVKYR